MDKGVELHFLSENIDSSTVSGRLVLDVIAAIAINYSRNLSREVKKGLYGRLGQGRWPFAPPPGYMLRQRSEGERKELVPDPVQAPLLKETFDLYASGDWSQDALRKKMTAKGLRNSRGKPFNKESFSKVLQNPFAAGIMKVKGECYEGKHETIITKRLYDEVQLVREGKVRTKRFKNSFLYRGMVFCAQCGRLMTGERQKGHVYYRCHTNGCETKTIREEILDSSVAGIMDSLTTTPKVKAMLQKKLKARIRKLNAQAGGTRQDIQLQLGNVNARLEKTRMAVVDGKLETDDFQAIKERLLTEEGRLKELLQKAEELNEVEIAASTDKLFELVDVANLSYRNGKADKKREMLKIFFSNLCVQQKKPEPKLKKELMAWADFVTVRNSAPGWI